MQEEFYSVRGNVTLDGIEKQGAVLLAGGCITSIGSRFLPIVFFGVHIHHDRKEHHHENLIELHTAEAGIPGVHKSREYW